MNAHGTPTVRGRRGKGLRSRAAKQRKRSLSATRPTHRNYKEPQ